VAQKLLNGARQSLARAILWGWRGAKYGFIAGGVIGAVISVQLTHPSGAEFAWGLVFGPLCGAGAFAAIPLLTSVWLLLLHMVSQLSGAARAPVESDRDDDESPSAPTAAPVPTPVRAARTAAGNERVCPDCGESVKATARICRFCRYEFSSQP
jgi:hypothetical protein